MPINISNLSTHTKNSAAQTNSANEQKHVKAVHDSSGDTNQASKAMLEPDSVNLTNSAKRIKSLENQIARLPIVDTQQVEQIRNSLRDGTFEFNSVRVAEKFINFEKDLF